jgi:dTDP-L-rhamnose 4-epimerase
MQVLLTGGAGFIGQHLCRKLLMEGYNIKVLDNFHPQIHGTVDKLSDDIAPNVDLIKADIRDGNAVSKSLENVDVVIHLASETGTGQSMYQISRYFDVNVQGTANLLDIMQNNKTSNSVHTLIIASSRAVYGEGSYTCNIHGTIFPEARSNSRMSIGDFELYCPECGEPVVMLPTEESAPFNPLSIYGLTKQVQ